MGAPGYRELVRSALDLRWQLDPVSATAAGVGEPYDGMLGRFTRADARAAVAAIRSVAGALEAVTADDLPDAIDQTALLNDLRIAAARLDRERPHELNPEFHLTHLLSGLFALLMRRDQEPASRALALAKRLAEVPRFLDDARATLDRPARVFTETALDVARGGLMLLRDAVPAFASTVPVAARDALGAALPKAREALEGFRDFLAGELLDRSDGEFAIGRDAFDFRLHYEHALQESAPELLRYGEGLVAECERELALAAEALAPGVTWRGLVERLRGDLPSRERLVETYEDAMRGAREAVAARGLVTVPEGALEVLATPPFLAPLVPFAAYDPPGAFAADRTGWFYVTVPATDAGLRDHCRHEITCTAVHEGVPGHHLQFLVAQRQPSPVRRVISSALTVEGWALYCEQLAEEQGLLTSPEERLFRRLHLLWRAARIVLDVKLHTAGLSLDAATAYLMERVGISRPAAQAEVRRYAAAPAYQLCYALGRRDLLRLREDRQQRDGAAFDLRRFHDEVLSYGGLPVSMIRWGMGL